MRFSQRVILFTLLIEGKQDLILSGLFQVEAVRKENMFEVAAVRRPS
jgi:hypothetical protein